MITMKKCTNCGKSIDESLFICETCRKVFQERAARAAWKALYDEEDEDERY